ncbi:MAG: hypothetical protein ACOX52_09925 [Verrucomicrobiota bacterium]
MPSSASAASRSSNAPFHTWPPRPFPASLSPLLRDGCVDTEVDAAWVEDTLALSSTNAYWLTRIDIDALRAEVDQWFTPPAIRSVLGEPGSSAELLAQEWLCKGGKRWRPFLSAAVYSGSDRTYAAIARFPQAHRPGRRVLPQGIPHP